MKIQLILLQLLYFTVLHTLAASIAVLSTPVDNPTTTNKILTELRKSGSAHQYTITSTYDISKVLSHKPDAILLVSDTTINTFNRYSPLQHNTEVPLIAVCSINSYRAFKFRLPAAQFCVNTIATNELFRQLSQFSGRIYPSAGFLYTPDQRNATLMEISQLRKSGIAPITRLIAPTATDTEITKAIQLLTEEGATTVRCNLSDSNYNVIATNPAIQRLFESSFSVILTDHKHLHSIITQTPILSIEPDDALYARAIALVVTTVAQTGKLSDDLTFSTETGTLRFGMSRSEPLTASRAILMSSLDSLLKKAGKTITGDSLRTHLSQILRPITELGISSTNEQLTKMSEAEEKLNKPIIYNITTLDFALFFIVLATSVIIILILRKSIKKLTHTHPVAMLYPHSIATLIIQREDKRPQKLKRILHKEFYASHPMRTFVKYRNYIERHTPDLHIIEWDKGSDIIIFLQHIFDKRTEPKTEPVIIFNISKKHQIEIIPRFSKTPLYLFENEPSQEELERAFYGKSKHEYHVSTIAGSLSEESLPQILQVLESNSVTGALLIEDPEPFSVIFYKKGLIVHAQDRFGSSLEESIYSTLSKQNGSFRFEKNRKSTIEKATLTSMDILMGWAAKFEDTTDELQN